jgi:hypothetical protein
MKLAVLGTDSEILRLAAAAREEGYLIVWVGDVRQNDAAAIWPLASDRTDRAAEWELLLGHGVVDAVLMGRGDSTTDLRAEQLKRLVVEAIPVLVVHPLFESVLPYYEVDMTRRETGGIVQHYNPIAGLPVADRLADWVRNGHPAIGAIHQVTFERRSADSTRVGVLGHLARDVELLAAVAGDIRRVSAIGPAAVDSSFASLQIQMSATEMSSLRWSVASSPINSAGMQLKLLGERGTITLQEVNGEAGDVQWHLNTTVEGTSETETISAEHPARRAIERLATAVVDSDPEERAAASTWPAATRDMEVVDAVELSLQKGRTIEVFQQQLTEQLAFRGTMAALGCGLLLLVFFGVIGVAMLGGAEGVMRQRLAPAWPIILLAVLAFFLLLQAVPLLAQKARKSDDGKRT